MIQHHTSPHHRLNQVPKLYFSIYYNIYNNYLHTLLFIISFSLINIKMTKNLYLTVLFIQTVCLLVSDAFLIPSINKIKINAQINLKKSSKSELSMATTLYGSQGSRSPLVNWGAYELNVPIVMGDLSKNPHPFGQIPCLTDDGNVLAFESGAILQYVYSKANTDDSASRKAAITSWIVWANASLDPVCFLENEGRVYDTGLRGRSRKIDTLDKILSKQEFLVDGGFSLADVAVASYLLYVPQFFPDVDLSRWPNIVRYMKQCAEREKYGEAFGPRVQSFLVEHLGKMNGGSNNKKLFGMF